jgi:Co/Zn/Cd efflux system component
MSDTCNNHGHGCCPPPAASHSASYRRVLWAALWINAAMFCIEIAAGLQSGSVSLLADAVDFFGDAANYGVSLLVLGMALHWRARAALLKGLTMGAIGALALAANVAVALMLYAWREGDANMRSVWLCSRNDAIGNLAVLAAALGVFGTGSAWPDLAVAVVMAALALTAARAVVKQALAELRPVAMQA